MGSASLYSQDHYVVLRPGQAEEFLTAQDTLALLQSLLATHPDALPRDLTRLPPDDQVQTLLTSGCELQWGPGEWLQWYAVRLEK